MCEARVRADVNAGMSTGTQTERQAVCKARVRTDMNAGTQAQGQAVCKARVGGGSMTQLFAEGEEG